MRRLARHCAQAQLAALILLTGCASDPQVVAVKTQIAPAPAACRRPPPAPPRLPERDVGTGEFARFYGRLQAQYLREAGRYRLCQKYVSRLSR